jgi:hypothetical protein
MRIHSLIVGATVVVSGALAAQTPPPASGHVIGPGKIAGIAPTPAQAPVFPSASSRHARSREFVIAVPVLIAPDGSVFADFGYGYERVLRNCNTGATNVAAQYGRYQRPAAIPPRTDRTVQMAGSFCWATDLAGNVVVLRP